MEDNDAGYNGTTKIFNTLCENIQTKMSYTDKTIHAILSSNQQLYEHNLPNSMLLHFTLITSQLQRTFIDMSSQVKELVRLVYLYSESWEEKVDQFNKLYEKQKYNQLKLEIALKKMNILEGRNCQLEKSRVLMNWQRIMMKLKKHKLPSLAWNPIVKNNSNFNEKIKKILENKTVAENLQQVEESQNIGRISRDIREDKEKEELKIEEKIEKGVVQYCEKCKVTIDEQSNGIEKILVQSSLENNKERCLSITPSLHSRSNSLVDNKIFVDNGTITREESLSQTLNVRIFKPLQCLEDFKSVFINIALDRNIIKRNISNLLKDDEIQMHNEIDNNTLYEEFSFKLPKDVSSHQESLENLPLRIAFHENISSSMKAFASVKIKDVCLYTQVDVERDECNFNEIPLIFPNKEDKEKDGSLIQLMLFLSTSKDVTTVEKATETISFDDIVNKIIIIKKMKFRYENCQNVSTETEEKPIYTESHMNEVRGNLKNELLKVKDDCESQIQGILNSHGIDKLQDVEQLNDIATSPIPWINANEFDYIDYERVSQRKPRNKILSETFQLNEQSIRKKKSSKWGRNLPDFKTRLINCKDASEKYHIDLKNKIQNEIQNEYLKKLDAEYKLSAENQQNLDLQYLPAIFMPMRKKLKQPIVARSFLKLGKFDDNHICQNLPSLNLDVYTKQFKNEYKIDVI